MEQSEKLRREFYNFFENGYDFEFFLKEFLKDLGFKDIKVTKKSRDGGIDLICYKDIIEGINTIESEKFIVQAKKYDKNIVPEKVRALNDARNIGVRKLFITTSDFSQRAREEAKEMPDMSLISGNDIINFYIQNKSDKIFDWEPKLSVEKLSELISKNKKDNVNNAESIEKDTEKILRVITKNDVRARILRIPNEIFEKISKEDSYDVVIDGCEKRLNMIKEIKSFVGITEFYRNHNYIDSEQANRNSYWRIDINNKKIYVELEDWNKTKAKWKSKVFEH